MQIIPMTRRAALPTSAAPATADEILRRMEVTRRQWPRLNEPLTLRERQVANILAELFEKSGRMPTMQELFEQFKALEPTKEWKGLEYYRKSFATWLRSLARKKVIRMTEGRQQDALEAEQAGLAGRTSVAGFDPTHYELVPGAFVDPWTVLLRLGIPADKLAEAAEAGKGKPNLGAARRIKDLVDKPQAQAAPAGAAPGAGGASADIAAPQQAV